MEIKNKKQDLNNLLEKAKEFQEQSQDCQNFVISLIIRDIEKVLNTFEIIPNWVFKQFDILLHKIYFKI